MLDWLIDLDKTLLLFCNGTHYPFLDTFFWIVTSKWLNIFLIVPLLYIIMRGRLWKEALLVVVAIALTVTICDQVASSVCKPLFERLRPTHDPTLSVITVNGYTGGLYGFISSHAANSFGVAIFLALLFRNKLFTIAILFWAAMVSYSRIYLGVHFPGDILAGALWGAIAGWAVYTLYNMSRKALSTHSHDATTQSPYRCDKYASYFAIYIFAMFFVLFIISFI